MVQSRTHNCGELRLADAGKDVTVVGWYENIRKVSKNLGFLILRDFYGTTQVVIETEDMMSVIDSVNKESTIQVTGVVRERSSKNTELPTGEIEVVPSKIEIHGKCRYNALPFKILILLGGLQSVNKQYYDAAKVDGTPKWRVTTRITVPLLSPMIAYVVITGFIGAFKAYSDAVALFGTDLNAAEMNTIVGYVYDMLYGDSGGYPSYASAAAIILFAIVLTITCINLLVSKKHVHYA